MTDSHSTMLLMGAGAIGQLVAYQWQQANLPLVTLPRKKSATDSYLRYQFRGYQSNKIEACAIPFADPSDISAIHAVFIAVKAYDLVNVFKELDRIELPQQCPIICAHNGLVDLTTTRPCYTWITTQGVTRSPEVTEHKGLGVDWIDNDIKKHRLLSKQLHAAFTRLEFDPDINTRQWQKFCLNCVINPLTAVHQCLNGELLAQRYQQQYRQLVIELVTLSEALGYWVNADELLSLVESVCQATAANQSSMLSDVKAKRKTEIEALTGYALKKAAEVDINMPTHAALYQQFNQLYLR